jgi:hypothetical protein
MQEAAPTDGSLEDIGVFAESLSFVCWTDN